MEKGSILTIFNINLKNYNNELEKILENKLFSYDAKNLLLSMLYKIENAYKDYEAVKVEVPTKNEYIENILRIIKEKATKILIAKIGSEEAKKLEKAGVTYKVDKNNGEIVCFQNEITMLIALLKLDETEFKLKGIKNYAQIPMCEMINHGKMEANLEVIRNFNGWSWEILINEIKNIEYNFIYQNLLLLYGKNLLKLKDKIPDNIIKMAIKKYILDDENNKYKKELKDIEKNKKERLSLFKNKKEFINQITQEKKEYTKQIEKIDKMINNNEELRKEYFARNEKLPNKEKIFSVSFLVKILDKEREELLEKIDECNKIILPKEYIAQKQKIEAELEFIENIFDKKIEDYILEICKEFLQKAREQIEKINDENKKELIKWIYKIRYYRYIPINNHEYIKDIKAIEEDFENVIKEIIKKAQKLKIWDIFTDNFNLTYMVLKEIFDTKIIYLEEINMSFSYENNMLYVEYYDDDIIESSIKFEVDNVKIKKKVKLFI